MVELAVVRNQQNAGGVGIQASDGLHVDVAHVVGKQAEHTRIIARFVRGFVIGRFVQYDIKIRLGNGLNGFAVDVQGADFRRIDFAFAVVADFAVDGNAVVINQPLALFAAAQSLGLQIFEQLHGLSRDVFRRPQLCQRRPSEKRRQKKSPLLPGAQKEHKPLPKLLHYPEAGQTRSAAGYKARCRSCGDNAESNLSLILNLPCSGQSSNRRQLQSMPSASRHLRRRAAQASR